MSAPTGSDIFLAIMSAASHQLATTGEAKAIQAAGLGDALVSLIEQIAGNAANPIAMMIEDALALVVR